MSTGEKPRKNAVSKRAPLPRGVRLFFNSQREKWCVQTTVGGVRSTQSFETKAMAELHAKEAAQTKREHGAEGIAAIAADEVKQWLQVKKALGDAPLDQMLAVWHRHKGEVVGCESGVHLGDAVKRFLNVRAREGLTGDSFDHVEKRLERFVAAIGKTTPVVSVTDTQIRNWLDSLKLKLAFKPMTVAHHLKSVRAFFNRAVKQGWCVRNPGLLVELPKEKAKEVAVLSIDDAEKLFRHIKDSPFSLRLALEAFAGMRYSSTARLHREDIKLNERGILMPAAKHKSGRRHYHEGLPENIWDWIRRWWDDPTAWSVTQRQLLEFKSKAFEAAGVPHPHNVLRHSFCSYHVALHSDAGKTSVLMQHTSPTMLWKHYRGVATKADAERFFGIKP